jgi:hypothetical protein
MFLKKMRPIIFLAGIVLLLTACNFPGADEEPTADQWAVYTEAALTVVAQQTQAVLGTPIGVASPIPGGAATSTPPMVIVPTATPLAPTNTPLPTFTPVPPTATPIPIPCDRAQFISDVTIPDNTEIGAGTTFVKTWRLKNSGSCTWTSGYAVVFYNGDAMSGPSSASITTGTVPPGSTVDVSVSLIAPINPGTYRGNWRLRNTAGALFGIGNNADQSFWVQIKSVAPTPTPSPTSAYTLSFDFIARGPDASWKNATTNLPWGDPAEDYAGVAVNVVNVKMEDGKTYGSLLATYPQHINNGKITGIYPAYTIQANDHLRTKIGFKSDCGSSSVKFQIKYMEGSSEVTVGEWLENCEGGVASLDVNLSALVGHTVQFELVVVANGTPDVWSTLWVSPRIER